MRIDLPNSRALLYLSSFPPMPAGWSGLSRGMRILMAGVSAMAFFFTLLFVVRAGDKDVGVGPSGFLQIFWSRRPGSGSQAGGGTFRCCDYGDGDVDFADALSTPTCCLALMQNVKPRQHRQVLNRVVEDLEKRDAEPSVKALLLEIELINVVGVDMLTTAVNSLGGQIRSVPEA